MKLVSLHHVSVSYDKVPVLTDVDLDIQERRFHRSDRPERRR